MAQESRAMGRDSGNEHSTMGRATWAVRGHERIRP